MCSLVYTLCDKGDMSLPFNYFILTCQRCIYYGLMDWFGCQVGVKTWLHLKTSVRNNSGSNLQPTWSLILLDWLTVVFQCLRDAWQNALYKWWIFSDVSQCASIFRVLALKKLVILVEPKCGCWGNKVYWLLFSQCCC